jgi:hypothetical protein
LKVDALSNDVVPTGEFLEGFNLDGCHEFEEWVSQQRERFRSRALGSLLQAGEKKLAENRFVEAADFARKALALHPLSEPATRMLMNALAHSDDVGGALAAFRAYAARLFEAIGEKPSHGLSALAERYRRVFEQEVTPPQDREPKLVGHLNSHREVNHTAAEALRHGSRTILIMGAPGMGRTRLLDECGARLEADTGAVVSTARPLANDADAPWSALRLLLRSGLAQTNGAIGAAPGSFSILAAIAPDAGIKARPVEPRDVGEVAAAVRDLLSAIAREQPVMIAIDDVHFADKATLGALLAAMENLRTDKVVLGLSVPERLDQSSAELLRLRQEIGRRLPGVAVQLKPLPQEAIAALTAELAPWCTEPATLKTLSDRIYQESGGNPFYAVTLLRGIANPNTLREDLCQSKLRIDSTSTTTLPQNIKTAITARVVELDKTAQTVLAAATIGGPVFDLDLIGFLTNLDRAAIENALAGAERRHLVVLHGNRYAFVAPIVTEVISQQALVRGERQTLRRRAAEFLAGRTDLESRVTRVELLTRVEPGAESLEAAVALAGEAKNAGADHAALRALAAAERVRGRES